MQRKHVEMAVASIALAAVLGGCTTVGQVRNLDDDACGAAFETGVASILTAQHEAAADAARLGAQARARLTSGALGPRPFALAAPSGTDYFLFVEPAEPVCMLRLYGRQKGFTRYTNNLTWIETRALPGCDCTP